MSEADDRQSAADPALGALIDALSSGGQVDPVTLLRSQMQSQLPDDPQVAMLMRLLERRQQLEAERQAEAAAAAKDEEDEEGGGNREAREAMSDLQQKIDGVYAELEALRARNDA